GVGCRQTTADPPPTLPSWRGRVMRRAEDLAVPVRKEDVQHVEVAANGADVSAWSADFSPDSHPTGPSGARSQPGRVHASVVGDCDDIELIRVHRHGFEVSAGLIILIRSLLCRCHSAVWTSA